MESLNIFGMIAFVFAILLWGRVQRLEQLLRENGIRPAGTRDLSRRLAKLAGQTVTLSLYSDGWDVSGLTCRVLDADSAWLLVRADEGKKKERRSEEELRGRIDYLFDTGVITAEAMNFMRGRSITDTWLIIDEAQNLTPRQVKGIVTRVGKGTKVVLLGDPAQIDHPLLDTRSNGLTYASARMRGSPLCVQLTMLPDECQRSPLALDAAVRM